MALALILGSCTPKETVKTLAEQNPAAEGFNVTDSDPAAIQLADSIMHAMGGRGNWDEARFISWNFNGRRDLVWDKQTGQVRIESTPDSTIYLVNEKTGVGRVRIKGIEITEPDSLKKLLDKAKAIWINDSYWLVMPYKIKDSGVTIKYMGEDTLKGNRYNSLILTFKEVGVTPQNMYKLYVDKREKLVRYWAYYPSAAEDKMGFVRPWDNYQNYGGILMSADRSDGAGPKNLKVDESLPDKLFTEF
ncbi:MAG: hypothetical protein JNM78_16995 [Cyclobacteriaceae bacterium]|nr:hypothetical protein [Cyclobacteriaceae bacterium]